jgi:DNA/RNA-binding domain of Phe-tRNA-synthetase-like protein
VLKGQDLYRINNAVDSCNLSSLSMLLPIGMYDLALVQGDVQLRTGAAGEEYPGIRKGPVHLEGRLGLFDREGPFGSPTSDSARTSVSTRTRGILAVIMATAGYPSGQMQGNLELFSEIFGRHCGGTTAFQGVIGRGEVA